MSRNNKNNHYHYAEKFSDRARRRERRSGALLIPRRALFFALLVLIAFGVISTTFSYNEPESDPSSQQGGSIIVSVRNAKANHDLAVTGANVDLAGTGYRFQGAPLYFVAPTDWDLSRGVSIMSDGDKNWSETYAMNLTRIGSSRIYYFSGSIGTKKDDQNRDIDFDNNDWFCFINESDWGFGWGDENRRTYAEKYTTCETSWDVKDGKAVFTGTKIGDTAEYDLSGSYYSDTNFPTNYSFNQVFRMQYKIGSGSYSNADATHVPGTATLATSYWNTDYKGGGTTTKTIAHNDYTYNRGVKTAPVTLSASDSDGYQLDGIYDSSGTRVDTTTAGTYNYTISAASTYYARYSARTFSITYNLTDGVNGSGTGDYAPAWKSGYTAPTSRLYTNSTTLPTAENLSAKGRTFAGWYTNAACTGDAVTSIAATEASNVTLYAKWDWNTFTVTYHDGSGSPVTTGSITGSVSTGSKTYDVPYTITNSTYTRTGFTQVGWATSSNATSIGYAFNSSYTTNENLDLYPVWSVDAPTASLSGGTMVVGGSLNLSPSFSEKPDDVTQAASYTITGPESTRSIENGVFTTNVPGTYTITVTVTNTASTGVTNVDRSASVTSSAVTVYVKPIAPVFTLTMNGAVDASSPGTAENPIKILLDSDYSFVATINDDTYYSDYTYEWSTSSDFRTVFYSSSAKSITFDKNYVPNQVSHADTASDEGQFTTVTLYCRAVKNQQNNTEGSQSIVYYILPLVEDFNYLPYQLIYMPSDSSLTLTAKYNLNAAEASGYTTTLKYSNDNYDFSTDAGTKTGLIEDFADIVRRFMFPTGPKYFYMILQKTGTDIMTQSPVAHTTVGTADKVSTRPLYFYNKTALSMSAYQIMCYWLDSESETGYGYQIAQDCAANIENGIKGFNYRVNLPSTATAVRFALVSKGSNQAFYYYGKPALNEQGTDFEAFAAPVFGGSTNLVQLSDTTRVIETESTYTTSSQTVGEDTYSIYSFTCTGSPFKKN